MFFRYVQRKIKHLSNLEDCLQILYTVPGTSLYLIAASVASMRVAVWFYFQMDESGAGNVFFQNKTSSATSVQEITGDRFFIYGKKLPHRQ